MGTRRCDGVLCHLRIIFRVPQPSRPRFFRLRFCPFRFLHRDNTADTESAASVTRPGVVPGKLQPLPPMFGGGRHMCPGRELAKLEMLMFLKVFLTKFDYELVGGQNLKGQLPTNGPKDKMRMVLKPKTAAT